ncbi:MAG: hypothetical protein KA198_02720 [Chitinophagaceae bacterium]|nr:hypothetical protein [Chitinophagaceae bacterium]
METSTQFADQNQEQNQFVFETEATRKVIDQCVLWARVCGFLSVANILLGLVQMGIGFIKGNESFGNGILSFGLSTLFSLLISFNLLQFASRLQKGVQQQDVLSIHQSLGHLRVFFMTMGFLFIISLFLLFVGIILIALTAILK